jgi:LPXTG-motif cell wall-anchored protein
MNKKKWILSLAGLIVAGGAATYVVRKRKAAAKAS